MEKKVIIFSIFIIFVGVIIISGIFLLSTERISIEDLLPEFLDGITAFARQLGSLTIPEPLANSTFNESGFFNFDCFMDFGGGSGTGTTGDGNWTFCSGGGCTPTTLLTTGSSGLIGNDADGLYSCSGNGCGNVHSIQNVTADVAGIYRLKCDATDQDGPFFSSTITEIEVVGAPSDSCTYSSGNWVVDCADNCSITSNVDVTGNNISITGGGIFTTTANITNFAILHIEGNSSTQCVVRSSGDGGFKA